MIRYSISAESRALLAAGGVADAVADYLKRYASFVEDICNARYKFSVLVTGIGGGDPLNDEEVTYHQSFLQAIY